MTRNVELERSRRRLNMRSPLHAVVRDWPWKAAAAGREPELAYWLVRAEAPCPRDGRAA